MPVKGQPHVRFRRLMDAFAGRDLCGIALDRSRSEAAIVSHGKLSSHEHQRHRGSVGCPASSVNPVNGQKGAIYWYVPDGSGGLGNGLRPPERDVMKYGVDKRLSAGQQSGKRARTADLARLLSPGPASPAAPGGRLGY